MGVGHQSCVVPVLGYWARLGDLRGSGVGDDFGNRVRTDGACVRVRADALVVRDDMGGDYVRVRSDALGAVLLPCVVFDAMMVLSVSYFGLWRGLLNIDPCGRSRARVSMRASLQMSG